MIASIIGLVVLLTCIIAHKHITMLVGLLPLIFVFLVSFYFDYLQQNTYWFIVPLLFSIIWIVYKMFNNNYDFSHKIISLMPNLNKNKGRIIGKVLPYTKSNLKYNNSMVVQSELASKGGTLICGSSGSGKTYGMLSLIKQDLAAGKSVAFFDFKGDLSTLKDIKESAKEVDTYTLSFEECDFVYDPLVNLDEGGRVEAILNMRKWSLEGGDDHYKTGVQSFLQKSIREFDYTDGNYLLEYYNFLKTYNVPREHYDSYNTTLKLIELTITSKISDMFKNEGNKFDFNTDRQFLLLVSFTSSTKTLATSITSLMFKDLMEVGTRNPYNPTLCLYIDEFGSCENALIVKDILEKGRSCGIATMLAMQDINQLVITTSQPFLDSVLGTLNNYIIYSGATKTTAEKLAGVQIAEIEGLLMSLKKPIDGKPPTCIYISKYPVLNKNKNNEVYRVSPFDFKKDIKEKHEINMVKLNGINNEYHEPKPVGYEEDHNYYQSSEPEETIVEQQETKTIKFNIDDFV